MKQGQRPSNEKNLCLSKIRKNVQKSTFFLIFERLYEKVKYSPPIEAGASFNPPNLAKDFILQASVSEAMGFL